MDPPHTQKSQKTRIYGNDLYDFRESDLHLEEEDQIQEIERKRRETNG
jgi:hypothetical protein